MFHHGLRWRVMLRVATTPLSAGELPMEKLVLDPEKTYIAYDFWKQEYLGEVRGSFSCSALELGCCQVVAFYEKGDAPMVIASDRHVSMDAVSVLEHTWEHGVLSLRLKGVPPLSGMAPSGHAGRFPAHEGLHRPAERRTARRHHRYL